MTWCIYAILDPSDRRPRYVGSTSRPIAGRLDDHLRDARAGSELAVHRWLMTLSCRPEIVALSNFDEVRRICEGDRWDRELAAIDQHRLQYPDLLNGTQGRPMLAPADKRTMISFRVHPETAAMLKELADEMDMSQGGVIDWLIEQERAGLL